MVAIARTEAKLNARIIRGVSPVSAPRANGVARRTGYAGAVRIWLAIVVTLAGCNDPELTSLTDIRAATCACKTASCAEQAMKRVPKTTRSTPRTQEISRAMLDCRAKLEEAERPSTDPDAEEATATEPPPGAAPPAPAPPATTPRGAAKP